MKSSGGARTDFGMQVRLASRREVLKYGPGAVMLGATTLKCAVAEPACTEAIPVVRTSLGTLRGRTQAGVSAFKGIPYAASTAEENRFRAPQQPAPWKGVRDAFLLGAKCPQLNPNLPLWLDPAPATEDCLCLNVWTPSLQVKASLPVMVWFHGGAFLYGSGGAPMFDGQNLAKAGNVVVVTVNHRLNVFGYLYLADTAHDTEVTGNAGQLDLIAALQWIHTNIEHFGGNPSSVTVFGESGGGAKINTLMAMPAARNLFHKAIIESGSLLTVMEKDEAIEIAGRVAHQLGLNQRDVKELRKVPVENLLAASKEIRPAQGPNRTRLGLEPVVDGVTLARQPWGDSAPEGARGISMLIGTNLDETVGLIDKAINDPIKDDRELLDRIKRYATLSDLNDGEFPRLLEIYRRETPQASRTDLLVQITTDVGFWRSAARQAMMKARAGGAPAFVYELSWRTPCFGGAWSLHGCELPFVFGIKEYGGSVWDGADSDALRAAADPQNDRSRLTDQIVTAWSTFARTGSPSTPTLPWPAYDLATRRTMILDRNSHVAEGNRSPARDAVLSI